MHADPDDNDWNDVFDDDLFSTIASRVRAHPDDGFSKLKNPLVRCASNHWTLLHWLCSSKTCSDRLVLRVLDAGVPVDAKTKEDVTALHLAARDGSTAVCKALLARGANLDAHDKLHETPYHYSVRSADAKMVPWLLDQSRSSRLQWDATLFRQIMQHRPEAACAYLDKFAINISGTTTFDFFDVRSIYGEPSQRIEATALSIAVELVETKNVLTHPAMQYVIWVKWKQVKWILHKEMMAYSGLLLAYYGTIMSEATIDWTDLTSARDYGVMVLRIFAWLCCLYLMLYVERREFAGGKYFRSIWNWLNIFTYGVILASIPIECLHSSSSSTRHGILALVIVLLWANAPQYLRIFKETGLLITTMRRMIQDIRQFAVLYSAFMLGVSGGMHLILGDADGYRTLGDTIITVLLMLFGSLTYDPFNNASGWKWAFSNLLLLVYLVCVVIMLLNVLIAMMTTSYELIREEAIEQFWLHRSETILRIERSLPASTQRRIFRQLVSNVVNQEITLNGTLPADFSAVMLKKKAAKPMSESEWKMAGNKIQPFEKIPVPSSLPVPSIDLNESKSFASRDLDDGIHFGFHLSGVESKNDVSVELEDRLSNLRDSVNEETTKQVCALQSSITELRANIRTEMQAISASIMDIQKQQQAFQLAVIEKLNRMDNEKII